MHRSNFPFRNRLQTCCFTVNVKTKTSRRGSYQAGTQSPVCDFIIMHSVSVSSWSDPSSPVTACLLVAPGQTCRAMNPDITRNEATPPSLGSCEPLSLFTFTLRALLQATIYRDQLMFCLPEA